MIQEEKGTEKGRKGAAVKVLSFGSLNLDFRYEVEHILRPGETLASKSLELHFGGKGFNQSVALSRGGAKVWHVGKVGKDGKDMVSFLEEKRLDVWTHNKAIQKACESRRVTVEQKRYLRGLKCVKNCQTVLWHIK